MEGVPDTFDNNSSIQGRALYPRATPREIDIINNCPFPHELTAIQPPYNSLSKLIKALDADNAGTKGWDNKVFSKMQKYYIAERSCSSAPGFRWNRLKTTTWVKTWMKTITNDDGEVVYDENGKPREKTMRKLLPDIPEYQIQDQNIDHVCQSWDHLDSYFKNADIH